MIHSLWIVWAIHSLFEHRIIYFDSSVMTHSLQLNSHCMTMICFLSSDNYWSFELPTVKGEMNEEKNNNKSYPSVLEINEQLIEHSFHYLMPEEYQ